MKWLIEMNIVHRGDHDLESCPENSLGAFRRAAEKGYAMELDVWMLKDKSLVVFHDDHLGKMTGYNKNIKDCTYDEIKSLKLLNSEEKIPLFKDVLNMISGRVPLMIELKNTGKPGPLEEQVYELLKGYNGEYVIQSFNPLSVGWFKKNAPEVIRGQLATDYAGGNISYLKRFMLRNLMLDFISRPDFIIYDIDCLKRKIVKYKRLRGKLVLGYTAKNKTDYDKAMNICRNVIFEGFDPNDK